MNFTPQDKLERLVEEAWSLFQAGQASPAERKLRKAMQLAPDSSLVALRLSFVLYKQKRFGEAAQTCSRLLRVEPDNADAWFNLALCQEAMRDFAEAARSYRRSLALAPGNLHAWLELGNALLECDQAEEAEQAARQAMTLHPQAGEPAHLLGRALFVQGRHAEALTACEQALALDASLKDARHLRATVMLALGQIQQAWPDYVRKYGMAPELHDARLLNKDSDVAGKTVALVTGLVGFGDVIQGCAYLPQLAARGARLVLQVQKPLQTLLAGLPGVQQVVTQPEDIPPHDYYAHIFLGMPAAFETTLETIPTQAPFLQAPAEAVDKWRARLATRPGLKIGLAWTAGHDGLRQRSLPLAVLAPLMDCGAEFYVLQKDIAAEDRASLKRLSASGVLHDVSGQLADFADTAGLMENLDLIISCDTATAHLAGALGRPVWVMLMTGACWRWFLQRDDSPWYPSARLFRQTQRGDWAGVVARVQGELTAWMAARRAASEA